MSWGMSSSPAACATWAQGAGWQFNSLELGEMRGERCVTWRAARLAPSTSKL